jgi:hypothetical protein
MDWTMGRKSGVQIKRRTQRHEHRAISRKPVCYESRRAIFDENKLVMAAAMCWGAWIIVSYPCKHVARPLTISMDDEGADSTPQGCGQCPELRVLK